MSTHKILIVDDNSVNLKLARVLLEVEGYMVATACDGESAVEKIHAFNPHLILMDLQLPGMDGLELTRLLKSDPATQNIRILAITAYAMKGDEQKALDAGCDGYLSKPIDTRTLPETIRKYL